MDRDVNRNKLTRWHAVTLLGAGAIVPLGGFKALGSIGIAGGRRTRFGEAQGLIRIHVKHFGSHRSGS
jgi:hypothetical protein